MSEYEAFAPNVEVNGETILSVINAMKIFKKLSHQILAENGITDPVPGRWYPQQAFLNTFRNITSRVGENTLFLIGKAIPANAQFPPGIDSLGKALASIDTAYHMNHRGGEIGHYQLKRTGERAAAMICENPYPCEFDRGIITAMTAKFKPKGSVKNAVVSHDDKAPCRKKGDESCTYSILW